MSVRSCYRWHHIDLLSSRGRALRKMSEHLSLWCSGGESPPKSGYFSIWIGHLIFEPNRSNPCENRLCDNLWEVGVRANSVCFHTKCLLCDKGKINKLCSSRLNEMKSRIFSFLDMCVLTSSILRGVLWYANFLERFYHHIGWWHTYCSKVWECIEQSYQCWWKLLMWAMLVS